MPDAVGKRQAKDPSWIFLFAYAIFHGRPSTLCIFILLSGVLREKKKAHDAWVDSFLFDELENSVRQILKI